MLKRVLTGTVLFVVVAGFFFLRLIDERLFLILLVALSALGSFEIARACGERTTVSQKILPVVYSTAVIPVFCFFGAEWTIALLCTAVCASLVITVFGFTETSLEGLGLSVLACFYPSSFIIAIAGANALPVFSTCALLLIFVTAPLTDVFAFFVGICFGKKKLCESVSPKKTVAGFWGGLLGGIVGAVIVYFACVILSIDTPSAWFVLPVGAFASALTELGDLAESAFKRKAGIKDSGRILPGHGGIMDRIDGISFAALLVYVCFTGLMLF